MRNLSLQNPLERVTSLIAQKLNLKHRALTTAQGQILPQPALIKEVHTQKVLECAWKEKYSDAPMELGVSSLRVVEFG